MEQLAVVWVVFRLFLLGKIAIKLQGSGCVFQGFLFTEVFCITWYLCVLYLVVFYCSFVSLPAYSSNWDGIDSSIVK